MFTVAILAKHMTGLYQILMLNLILLFLVDSASTNAYIPTTNTCPSVSLELLLTEN